MRFNTMLLTICKVPLFALSPPILKLILFYLLNYAALLPLFGLPPESFNCSLPFTLPSLAEQHSLTEELTIIPILLFLSLINFVSLPLSVFSPFSDELFKRWISRQLWNQFWIPSDLFLTLNFGKQQWAGFSYADCFCSWLLLPERKKKNVSATYDFIIIEAPHYGIMDELLG